jgi:hypothetical protein
MKVEMFMQLQRESACVCVYVCKCMYVCVCVRETERETERDRETERERETDRQTDQHKRFVIRYTQANNEDGSTR